MRAERRRAAARRRRARRAACTISSSSGRPGTAADDEHLPAGLDADARVDEQLGELTISRVSHCENIRRTYCFVKCRRAEAERNREGRTSERVLDGARRCFARHGYEGATVVRLEQEIGLSRGAIFNWFPSKEELFIALAAATTSGSSRCSPRRGSTRSSTPLSAHDPDWLAVYLEFGRRLKADAELRERWMTIAPEEARERSREWIEEGQAGGAPALGRLRRRDRPVPRRRHRRDRLPARRSGSTPPDAATSASCATRPAPASGIGVRRPSRARPRRRRRRPPARPARGAT